MTIKKAQFNASTLKASYTAGTSKAQVWNNIGSACEHCSGDTPKYIDVTITGGSQCTDCLQASPTTSVKYIGVPLPNGTFRLEQDAENPCYWIYSGVGSFGSRQSWLASGSCSGNSTILSYDHLYIEIVKPDPSFGKDIYLEITYTGDAGICWVFLEGYDVESNCLEAEFDDAASCGSYLFAVRGTHLKIRE